MSEHEQIEHEDLEPTDEQAEQVSGGADFVFVHYYDKSSPILAPSAPPTPPPTKP